MFKTTIKTLATKALATLILTALTSAAAADSGVYEQLLDSSVMIISPEENSRGSGVVVDADQRLVLTNFHVAGKSKDVVVFFSAYDENGDLVTDLDTYTSNIHEMRQAGIAVTGRVVGTWAKRDLCLIQLDDMPEDVAGVELANSPVKPGEAVHSLGNPKASQSMWIYSPGRVRQVHSHSWEYGTGQKMDSIVVQTTSPINGGDSGGPMVNDNCELVGIVCSTSTNGRLISMAIEVREVRSMLAWYDQHTADMDGPHLASTGF